MRRLGDADDSGSAIIEFVFVAVLVMVPLVYLVVAVASVQRSELAVSQAAREAGRAFATAESAPQALPRARAAVQPSLSCVPGRHAAARRSRPD
jgi:Flp pilus assembly protein TadG